MSIENYIHILCRKWSMPTIGKFTTKVYSTSDKKKLKSTSKIYTYGTVSIRDPKLNEHIGKDVIIKIFTKDEKKKSENK